MMATTTNLRYTGFIAFSFGSITALAAFIIALVESKTNLPTLTSHCHTPGTDAAADEEGSEASVPRDRRCGVEGLQLMKGLSRRL